MSLRDLALTSRPHLRSNDSSMQEVDTSVNLADQSNDLYHVDAKSDDSHATESFNFACNDNVVDECSEATVENFFGQLLVIVQIKFVKTEKIKAISVN